MVIHIPSDYDTVIHTVLKTEFLTVISSKYKALTDRDFKIDVRDKYEASH